MTDASSGELLVGANITLRPAGQSSDLLGAAANDVGQFELSSVLPGTYTLRVTFTGYAPYIDRKFEVGDADQLQLDIRLEPTFVSFSEVVVVTASRYEQRAIDAPAAVSIVLEDEIRSRPVINPSEHLKGLPGVDVASVGIGQDNVVIRGFNLAFDPGRVLFLTDNRIASIPSIATNNYSFTPAGDEDIERIEVVSGPGSAVYGPNALGGVLHIITKSPFDSEGTRVSISGGERSVFLTSFRHASILSPKVAAKISGEYFRADDWQVIDPLDPDSIILGTTSGSGRQTFGGLIPNTPDFGQERFSGEARIDFRANGDLTATFTGGFTQGTNMGLGEGGLMQIKDWQYGFVQARVYYRELQAQAYYTKSDSKDSYLRRNGDLIDDKSSMFVAQVQHSSSLHDGAQRLTYGADVLLTRPDTGIHGRNSDDDDINEFGAYLQSETRLLDRLKFIAAARVDNNNRLDNPVFSPRAGLVFTPSPNHRLRLTYNRAFESPRSSSLFLDLLVAESLGPLPYGIRYRGVPSETGFTYPTRDDGGLLMQSPFNPPSNGGPS
ncbi:MAG: TonB-dependent receptor, partial [Rhodothermales bacterium]|nr:TonB-dependent receptor [Rhodothermales bacterium]